MGLEPPSLKSIRIIPAAVSRLAVARMECFSAAGRNAWSKLACVKRTSSPSLRPMRRAFSYSSRSVVWNMAGSSVERTTGMP